jgi:putative transposase
MKYGFILKNKDIHTVEKMCKCMKLSKNSYYHWLRNKDTQHVSSSTLFLKDRIKTIFEQSKQIYGSCRVQKMLEREGLIYSRSYIGVLMKKMGLKSVLRRKFTITTDSKHSFPIAQNVLDRSFESLEIGKKWVSDITYIRVNDCWNYLTTIIDLADRKVVGWSLSDDMTAKNTILKAWLSARASRDIQQGIIFHSDRGVQYASTKMTNLFSFNRKIIQSMSRKGNCWDNAVAESFFKQ